MKDMIINTEKELSNNFDTLIGGEGLIYRGSQIDVNSMSKWFYDWSCEQCENQIISETQYNLYNYVGSKF